MTKRLAWECKLRDVARDWGSFCSPIRSIELSDGQLWLQGGLGEEAPHAMLARPPLGPPMLWGWESYGLSLRLALKGREPVASPHQGKGAQREEKLTCQLLGPQQPQSSLASSQECPPRPSPAPGVPLTLGRL